MNLSGMNFGMQPFVTSYPNLQTQLPQQINKPFQPINQPVNIASGLQMPMSLGTIPTGGRYYVPYPQAYSNNMSLQMPQSFGQQQIQTLPQAQAPMQIQTPQTNMQTFGQGQIQNPMQAPQEVPTQIQPTSQQQFTQVTPNCQTTNNMAFGQSQIQTQQLGQETPNVQTTNSPTFGQNQSELQSQPMSIDSLNAINNYPNSNPQIQNMQPNQIQQ